MNNRTFVRIIALILALVLTLSCLAGIVFAAEPGAAAAGADSSVPPAVTLGIAAIALVVAAIGGIVMYLMHNRKK